MDFEYMVERAGTVSRVTDAQEINFKYKTMVGTDGAISSAKCKTKEGDNFALTLQLPQVRLADDSHRKDIEKFMRAYFPATLKTLGCAGGATP